MDREYLDISNSTDGADTARISLHGGGLRALTLHGRVVIPLDLEDSFARWYTGVVMAPFANRVRDGRWMHDGVLHQLPLNDPLGHALHGLVAERLFTVVARTPNSVVIECTVPAVPGYPFATTLHVAYVIDDTGLTSTMTITNESDISVPVSLGAHPYFMWGEGSSIEVRAAAMWEVDERLIPTGTRVDPAARGIGSDIATNLAGLRLDDTFTDLERDDDCRAHVLLRHADGACVDIWQGEGFAHTVIFTCPEGIWRDSDAHAIAIEPQTSPTDALNSGVDVVWVEPGASRMFTWGVSISR